MGRKSVWTTLKDNAALVTAIGALIGVLLTGAFNTCTANKDQEAQRKLEAFNAKKQRELEAFNAEKQRELEEEKAQDARLQTFLDQMGDMLLNEELRSSDEGSDLRTLARARTLTTLRPLDAGRKTQILQFLVEANLVQTIDGTGPVISLENADLSEVDLQGKVDLGGADLTFADLRGADLHEADLRDAMVTQEQLDHAKTL